MRTYGAQQNASPLYGTYELLPRGYGPMLKPIDSDWTRLPVRNHSQRGPLIDLKAGVSI